MKATNVLLLSLIAVIIIGGACNNNYGSDMYSTYMDSVYVVLFEIEDLKKENSQLELNNSLLATKSKVIRKVAATEDCKSVDATDKAGGLKNKADSLSQVLDALMIVGVEIPKNYLRILQNKQRIAEKSAIVLEYSTKLSDILAEERQQLEEKITDDGKREEYCKKLKACEYHIMLIKEEAETALNEYYAKSEKGQRQVKI